MVESSQEGVPALSLGCTDVLVQSVMVEYVKSRTLCLSGKDILWRFTVNSRVIERQLWRSYGGIYSFLEDEVSSSDI